MKKLDLCVLADPASPTTTAYLAYLEEAGYEPAEVWRCEFAGGGRLEPVRRLLGLGPALWIKRFQDSLRTLKDADDWAARIERSVKTPIRPLEKKIARKYLASAMRLEGSGWKDPDVVRQFTQAGPRTYLYSVGGIVSREVLEVPGLKMLHLHPGILPEVRGGDGLLWSIKLRGRPGVTAFWMNAGIDTGLILQRKEFGRPIFSRQDVRGRWNDFYDALLRYYDPHLRAETLVELARRAEREGWSGLPAEEQKKGEGKFYRVMDPSDRLKVLESFCS